MDSECISMTSFLFLVNGSPLYLLFSASRGLCQRDPLSPFPFTIVAKVLGCLFSKARGLGLVGGFQFGLEEAAIMQS